MSNTTFLPFLQASENLVNFVKSINPCEDAVIRMGVNHRGALDCFLNLNEGNGREILGKLVSSPSLSLSCRGENDAYLDIKGEFNGYYIEVTFLMK